MQLPADCQKLFLQLLFNQYRGIRSSQKFGGLHLETVHENHFLKVKEKLEYLHKNWTKEI